MLKILDLGCGTVKVDSAIGMDNVSLPEVDVVHDLMDFPYPFESGAFDVIYLRHVIEHFELSDINKIFEESNRILKNNGLLKINVPHVYSIAAFTDITHKKYFTFTSGSFWDVGYHKSYYKEVSTRWKLIETKSSLLWFDWKRIRLRKLDKFLSNLMAWRINRFLKNRFLPSKADRIVKSNSFQFVEIQWTFQKVN